MDRDAIAAGVSKIGGLFKTSDVRVLICYILSSLNEPLSGARLCEVLHYEGFANAFEVSDSLSYLEEHGHIKEVGEKEEEKGYVITDLGRNIAKTLSTSLPIIVRDRAYKAVIKMMARMRNAKETEFKITHENGKMFLSCSAIDQGLPFMTVKLLVPDEEQAGYIKERFIDDSPAIFSKLIEMLTRGKD